MTGTFANSTEFRATLPKHEAENREKRGGQLIVRYINDLLYLEENGQQKYTLDRIRKMARGKSPAPIAKRIAAQRVLEMLEDGREGRDATGFVLDRLIGKPEGSAASVNVQTNLIVQERAESVERLTGHITRILGDRAPAALAPAEPPALEDLPADGEADRCGPDGEPPGAVRDPGGSAEQQGGSG